MISPIGSTSVSRGGMSRTADPGVKADVVESPKAPAAKEAGPVVTQAAQLAAEGAPVDTAKVSAIREGIANGTYKVDPQAIAQRMIQLDLPEKA